jgi:hypothetical protein
VTLLETIRAPTIRGRNANSGSTPGTIATTSCVFAEPVSVRPEMLPSPLPITSAANGSSAPGKVVSSLNVAV